MIHQFRQNGFNIVLDVYSGAVHVVDDLVFDILEALQAPLPEQCPPCVLDKLKERYTAEQIGSAYAEIMELYRSGQLFSEDDYGRFESLMSVSPVKAACLHIAHDCNLRCEYCFASTGEYGGHRALMSAEVGKAAIDFLLFHSAGRRNLEVDFFGGEPLMNFSVVRQIVRMQRLDTMQSSLPIAV